MTPFISFPYLGWRIPVSPELFSIRFSDSFTLTVRWYSVLIALGFALAFWYACKRAAEFEIKIDPMIDVILVCALFAIICARLYYVIFSDARDSYFADPVRILEIWKGGIAIYGAVIGAFVTALWMCPLRKVNTLRMFDLAAPGFLIGQALGRWGNFFNQEAFGGNTELPWGMSGSIIAENPSGLSYDPALPVHPTFLYESLWCLIGLLLLHIVSKKAYKFKGQLFSLYIVWYGTGRFFIEMLRTDSLYLGTMRVSCLVAAIAVVGGIILYFVLRSRQKETPADLFVEAEPITETEESTDGSEN